MDGQTRPGGHDADPFDRQSRIGWLDFNAIRSFKVLVVGAGAIGNEAVKGLVLSGFRDLTLVDMDRVVPANITRCVFFTPGHARDGAHKVDAVAEGVARLAPDCVLRTQRVRIQELGDDFVGGFDIILGCLDNLEARLHINSRACLAGKPYIDGAMESFRGKVQVVMPDETPCLECLTNSSHARIMALRFSCTGSDVTFHTPLVPAEITTTSIVGALMVREAVKLASGRRDLVQRGVAYYDGEKGTLEVLELGIDPNCPNHGK